MSVAVAGIKAGEGVWSGAGTALGHVEEEMDWRRRVEGMIYEVHEMLLRLLEDDAIDGLMELSDEGQEDPEGPLRSGGPGIWFEEPSRD